MSPNQRVCIANGIQNWQSIAAKDITTPAFNICSTKFLETIRITLLRPNDEVGSDYSFGAQMPALIIMKVVLKEVHDEAQHSNTSSPLLLLLRP